MYIRDVENPANVYNNFIAYNSNKWHEFLNGLAHEVFSNNYQVGYDLEDNTLVIIDEYDNISYKGIDCLIVLLEGINKIAIDQFKLFLIRKATLEEKEAAVFQALVNLGNGYSDLTDLEGVVESTKKLLLDKFADLSNGFYKRYKAYLGESTEKRITELFPHVIKAKRLITTFPGRSIQAEQSIKQQFKHFKWLPSDGKTTEEELSELYQILIAKRTPVIEGCLADFERAFSGDFITGSLDLKWLVKGKNKSSSKSALSWFIKELERRNKIEFKWSDGPNILNASFIDLNGDQFENMRKSFNDDSSKTPTRSEDLSQILDELGF